MGTPRRPAAALASSLLLAAALLCRARADPALRPSLRQAGPAVVLPIDGDGFSMYADCQLPGSEGAMAELEDVYNICAGECSAAEGCPRGCCSTILDGGQLLFCQMPGRCIRYGQATDSPSGFMTLEKFVFNRTISGRLNCPLDALEPVGDSCAIKLSGDKVLACADGVDVPQTGQLEDSETCDKAGVGSPGRTSGDNGGGGGGGGGGGKCFPADATVRLRGGEVRRMDALAAGDIVHVGYSVYSPVYMFSHKLPAGEHNFVQIATSAGDTLRLSPGHLLAVNGAFAAAWTVARGDTLLLSSGGRAVVTEIRAVRGKGLYNPHTLDGRIAVDGVVCSTYTDAVHAGFAHSVLLAPCRAAWRLFGLECGGGLLHGNSRAGVLLRSAWGALLGSAGVRSEL